MAVEKVTYRFQRYGALWKMIWLVRRIWVGEPLVLMQSLYFQTGFAIGCHEEDFGVLLLKVKCSESVLYGNSVGILGARAV